MSAPSKKRIAVLASGNGTNFQALFDACQRGDINGDIVALVSNQKYALALNRAREAGVEALVFESAKFKTRTQMYSKLSTALMERNVDLVCLAGYMAKIEPSMVRAFPNRILNIHPALLPKFGGKGMYGRHVHQAVIDAQEKESGCTVHLVNEVYDDGPVIARAKVAVSADDTPETLAQKIHAEEHKLYVAVVKDVCSGKLNLDTFTGAPV
jgi:phosphoribosylglycinamide formyltransferase-1